MATPLYAWPCALEPGHPVSRSDCPGRDAGVITSGATPRLARTRVARPHHAHAGCSGIMRGQALVAQPDRVVASEAIGRGFESLRAHQFSSRACAGIKKNPREIGGFLLPVQRTVHSDPLASRLIGHRWAHLPSTQKMDAPCSQAASWNASTTATNAGPGDARVPQFERSERTDRRRLAGCRQPITTAWTRRASTRRVL